MKKQKLLCLLISCICLTLTGCVDDFSEGFKAGFESGLSGTSESISTNNEATNSTNVQKKEKFTLQSHSGSYDELGIAFYIEGTIKNNTNKNYSYVQVTFNTYDKDGAQLGTAIANINNLEANGVWKYKAMAMTSSDEIASYKLVEITGF